MAIALFLLILFLIVIFGVLIFILRKILTKNVISATTHLKELNQDYSEKEKEINRRLEESKQKALELVAIAEKEAQSQKEKIVKDAKAESEEVIAQGRTQGQEMLEKAEKSSKLLIADIEKRITHEALDRAVELIKDDLPEEFKKSIHIRWVEDLINSGFKTLDRLHPPKDLKEIKVTTAFPLAESQKKNLAKNIKTALGYDAPLKEVMDEKIIAGIIVTIGNIVLDGSFRSKIELKAKGLRDEVVNNG